MCHYLSYAVIGYLATCSALATSADMTADCPARVPENSFAPNKPPAGWTGSVRGPSVLAEVGMMAAPPDELQYLVPNKEGKEFQVYEFQAGDRQRWLWCGYSGGLQLSRRLDDKATKCRISERRRAKELLSAEVKCQ